jgi:hypothetical protein
LAEGINVTHVSTSAPAVQAGSHFDVIVFRAQPEADDFPLSRPERLAGAATRAEAWSRLYAELRHDRMLIGGAVQEVH